MKYLLALICIFFLFTRLYKISEIPPSVYWDEVSIGYNAYSIAQTGKDEWGDFLPLHFRAFGEFKLPVYIYSVVPFVKIFGLNEFSLRFPAVLFSLGVVIITYLLSKKISGNILAGLFSSFFISISPWFFIFSRTGYEATAGVMFYLLGIYLFLLTKKNSWYILISTLSFVFSVYSYNSFRIITPATFLILLFMEPRNLKEFFNRAIFPVVLSLLLILLAVIPIYRLYVYDAGSSRLQAIGGVNAESFLKNYSSHFSPDFLLFGDKNLRSQQKDFGQIYLPELLLLILGLLYISRKQKFVSLPLALLLLGPIPAAITKESPHALRAISVVPFICIISAAGAIYLKRFFPKKFFVESAISIIFLAFFINYFINFITVYPTQSSEAWQYGYKKIFADFKDEFMKYDRIIISEEFGQPYIFALFYLKYDPGRFRQEVVRNSVDQWGFSTVAKFGKFEFGKIDQILKRSPTNALTNVIVFASVSEKIPNLTPLGTIRFLDGSTALWIYKL